MDIEESGRRKKRGGRGGKTEKLPVCSVIKCHPLMVPNAFWSRFPDPPMLCAKEGLVYTYKVRIGCAENDSAILCKQSPTVICYSLCLVQQTLLAFQKCFMSHDIFKPSNLIGLPAFQTSWLSTTNNSNLILYQSVLYGVREGLGTYLQGQNVTPVFVSKLCIYMQNYCTKVSPFLQGLNFLRMSARVDGVASRVQSAIQMRQVCSKYTLHTCVSCVRCVC